MNDVDILIREKFVPMKMRALEAFTQKHPHIFSLLNNFLKGKSNKFALRITENGATVGEYTFHLNGMDIGEIESGTLVSEIHHPIGVIKPYGIVERSVLEQALEDEEVLVNKPLEAMRKYMPDITIKFLR